MLLLIGMVSCKQVKKPFVQTRTIIEGENSFFDMEGEKVYGDVKAISDTAFNAAEGVFYWIIVTKFDENGNEMEADGYDHDTLRGKILFTYNSNDDVEKKYYYRYKAADTAKYTYFYNYDTHQHLTGYNIYYKDEKVPFNKDIDCLDASGNIITEYLFEGNRMTNKAYAIVYDNKGNVISRTSKRLKAFEERFKYDSIGNKIARILKTEGESAADTFRFDYRAKDFRGNWTRKYTYKNDKLANIIYRAIDYY